MQPIKPNNQRPKRTVILAANSRDRNMAQNFQPNPFRWQLRRPLKDVVSVELIGGSIPAKLYQITPQNNKFIFQENTTNYTIQMTDGYYTPPDMAQEIEYALEAIRPPTVNTYTVRIQPFSGRLEIIRNCGCAPFSLLFADSPYADRLDPETLEIVEMRGPAKLLGFQRFDYQDIFGSLQSPFPVDPNAFMKNIYMYINADTSLQLTRIELGDGKRDCFEVVQMDNETGGYRYFSKDTMFPMFYSAPAPIARLKWLDISFRDELYNPIDFNQRDMNLIFEITYLE